MGGTVQWAEGAAATPNWIFPFASLSYFSVANLTQFQFLMYRPLYWFGQTTSSNPTFNESLSVAKPPVYSNGGKTATVNLKGWKFSDGQTVDAQSVMFWMNMMKAEKANWAGYAAGYFPDNVSSYSAPSLTGNTVVFNMNKVYSANWLLYNEISMITPMPEAWDVTSLTGKPGSGGCGEASYTPAVAKACAAVWAFDTDSNGKAKSPQMAGDLSTYASNPLWKVVDGPWTLSAFNAGNGEATFVPNPKYSGPKKPYLAKFVELPFTTDTAEYSALSSNSSVSPQVGYIPPQDVPANTGAVGTTGANASVVGSNYNLVPVYGWGINYFPENFNSTGDGGNAGPIFKQLYVRQALQDLVDQTGMIHAFDKGYGVPTYGPVPVFPVNSFTSTQEAKNVYPYSVSAATALLKNHGWDVKPGGITTCAKPGSASNQCGANIKPGAQMVFTEDYLSGNVTLTQIVQYEVSSWAKVGIKVSLKSMPFDQVLGIAVPCTPSQSTCGWELANWGGGWIYAPDYLPTGEEIFASTAGSNSGSYHDSKNDQLIQQTTTSNNSSVFQSWENYLQQQLPVIWQPAAASALTEISKNLHGVTPINALLNLNPEYWYYSK